MKYTLCKLFGSCAALMGIMLLSAPAFAAEKEEGYLLDTVTVSAQKREENVQEVPLSMGVLNDVALEESRITKFEDIQSIVPGLFTSSVGTGTYAYMSVRGRINTSYDIDPTVTVLVDGVPYDDFYTVTNNPLFDIERVEVLRGPQSTMYGLNSIAGVINIISKQPSDETSVRLFGEGDYGDQWGGSYRMGGKVSGPIIENVLKGSLALTTTEQDGYITNQNTDENFDNARNSAVRGNFVLTPGEAWTISGGLAYTDLKRDAGYIFTPFDSKAAASLGQTFGEWETDIDRNGDTEVETMGANLKADYRFAEMMLTSVTAYRNSDQSYAFDADLSAADTMYGMSKSEYESFTQELRLQSDAGESSPLEWLVGYFYHRIDRNQEMGMAFPGFGTPYTPRYQNNLRGDSHALFGQGTYRFLDHDLGLTLGLRQEWTGRKVDDLTRQYFEQLSKDDSILLPKLALDYRLTEDHMLYASVTKGWRSGGVAVFTNSAARTLYDKETCWSYEAGAKTTWLDGKVRFNLAAFYTDYDDYQDTVSTGFLVSHLSNVPEVRMKGYEAELEAHLTKNLLLTAGYGYVDAQYMKIPDKAMADYSGNTVANVPDFDANLALRFSFLEHFYVRPEVQGVGTIYWDQGNTAKQDPYAVFNLRAGYLKDNYEIYVFGQNLTNEYAFALALDYNQDNNYFGNPIAPLSVGIGASITF